ncbi:DUF92 domain-containing protein [Segetibacter sp. 3557_3]|uniref:DUF92 domain-containing protein n=1 Tax=Segetibacter sp. 3557_3 TaxID=2547429 RepID=UPI001058E0E7|nr:DUF92 domain-containing protein [Segetibacter sp. 3557_3]TDH27393.1 DUF92 domain-containing protein [Segetibacter sp. 3557_3]
MPVYLPAIVILLVAAFIVVRLRKLTPAGGIAAVVTGLLVFVGASYTGLILLASFFTMGTAATSWNKSLKQTVDPSENQLGGRTAGQVFANGGVAALAGLFAYLLPQFHVTLLLMLAGSLSAATADTLSSEIGMVKGRRFYNILTFKKDLAGLNGVVSVEGTFAGILGSVILGACYLLLTNAPAIHFMAIVLAGTAGNLADSVLGASLERKHVLNNDAVNALNTIVGALTVLLFI